MQKNPYYHGPKSDHFDGLRFHGPGIRRDKTFRDVARMLLRSVPKRMPWPRSAPIVENPPPPARVQGSTIRLTFIGHSSFLLQTEGVNLLLDPVWSQRAGPAGIGPRRVTAPGLAIGDLPTIDAVLLSHNHYDHMDLPTLRQVQARWAPAVATGLGNARHLAKAGIRTAAELDWWQAAELAGAQVTYVPAQHFSSRTLRDRNRSLWGGFIIEAGGAVVYFAGDSGYAPHFAEIGQRFPRIDLALLPIGAYEPRWFMRQQHVNPEEAVRAHLDLGARRSLGMHFGTFQLTDEPIDAPVSALREALARAGLGETDFAVLGFGETRVFAVG